MTSKKILLNPNDNTWENQLKFWTAFLNWIQDDDFKLDLVKEIYVSNQNGNTTLSVKWEKLYREYYGIEIPFNIAMHNAARWDEIEDYIRLIYEHVIREDKRKNFEIKINEYLTRFKVKCRFLDGHFIESYEITEQPYVESVLEWIDAYPDAAKNYKSALSKLDKGEYGRNILDDMRLSLESLVRELTRSPKTLEHQINNLGTQLKNKGVSEHLRNMITTILNYYTKYQNDNVKHHDSSNKDDIEVVVNITSVMMKYLKERLG